MPLDCGWFRDVFVLDGAILIGVDCSGMCLIIQNGEGAHGELGRLHLLGYDVPS